MPAKYVVTIAPRRKGRGVTILNNPRNSFRLKREAEARAAELAGMFPALAKRFGVTKIAQE